MVAAQTVSAKTLLEQEWSRYQGWELRGFELVGAPSDLSGELKKGLVLTGQGRLLRSRRYPAFSFRLLREDMARTRLFLAREGYPAAEVEPVADLDALRRRLRVRFRIDPGPMVLVASISPEGWPADLPPPEFDEDAGVRVGRRISDRRLDHTRLGLRSRLRDSGFALAEVAASVRPVSGPAVAVVFTITPGDHYTITEAVVEGCSPNLAGVTRRVLDITPPVPYSVSLLAERTFDLRATQLYRQVSLETFPSGPGALLLEAQVEDARMRSLEASLGTWSDNPWMLRSGWTHRNLLGGGRGLDVRGGLATHTQNLGGGISWLGWLSPGARSRLGAEWVREDEDAYLSKELRLDLVQSFRPRLRDMAHVGVSLSRVSVTAFGTVDQQIVDRQGNLFEVWADRKWDWTDDPLYPARGGFCKLTATYSPPIGLSESPYLSVQGDVSGYRALSGRTVLAGRIRTGYAHPLGGTEAVLPNRRFYAGGYNTVRGYGRRQLGPRDSNGIARGGDLVLLAGTELRVPVVWLLEVALFADVGQVWLRPGDLRLSEMETSAGFDLDIRTPLGPARLGYAWNLGRVYPGQPEALAHFGMGYPW